MEILNTHLNSTFDLFISDEEIFEENTILIVDCVLNFFELYEVSGFLFKSKSLSLFMDGNKINIYQKSEQIFEYFLKCLSRLLNLTFRRIVLNAFFYKSLTHFDGLIRSNIFLIEINIPQSF